MMTHFRVVTSVSFGGGGNFLKNHNDEDQTPKFVIYLYNEKVLYTIRYTVYLHTHYTPLYSISILIFITTLQTDH